jgi:hypothetical protein
MAPAAEEKAFLRSAVAAIPRIAEIVCAFPPEDRAGALETAERRFMETALKSGCTEVAARSRVSAVMGRLRRRVEEQRISEKKLRALLHRCHSACNFWKPFDTLAAYAAFRVGGG